jgi:hypothetical protein
VLSEHLSLWTGSEVRDELSCFGVVGSAAWPRPPRLTGVCTQKRGLVETNSPGRCGFLLEVPWCREKADVGGHKDGVKK